MSISTIKNAILPLLALMGILWALFVVVMMTPDLSEIDPPVEPLSSPFKLSEAKASEGAESGDEERAIVAGTGILEPNSEEVSIGSHLSGVVDAIYVTEGQSVDAGDTLFSLNSRRIEAQRKTAVARIKVAEAELSNAKNRFDSYSKVSLKAAIAAEELRSRRYALLSSEAALEQAKAALGEIEAQASLHTVHSPLSGEVLQINLREGEFATAGGIDRALMILGNTSPLHARVDIDEFDLHRIHRNPVAEISPKGSSDIKIRGRFVRMEPLVTPKRNLSGSVRELVDTRVAQLIFAIEEQDAPVLSGQQIDAYIASDARLPLISEKQ